MSQTKIKTACVIFTYQAAKCGFWPEVLHAVDSQCYLFDLKLIVDSSSEDGTVETAKARGWSCLRLRKERFNHGLTRDRVIRMLAHKGYDVAVFLTQDIVPAQKDAVEKLISFLLKNDIAGCYGRQIVHHTNGFNAWQRSKTYPPESEIHCLKQPHGIRTTFFSNAFAAWKIREVIRYGGFPETDFGEDVLLAARILSASGKTGYCAEAVCYHDHSDRLTDLFFRGKQFGVFHRKHPEIRKEFGSSSKLTPVCSLPVSLYLPFAVKSAGYLWGRFADGIGKNK